MHIYYIHNYLYACQLSKHHIVSIVFTKDNMILITQPITAGCHLALSAAWASLAENALRRSDRNAAEAFVQRAEPGATTMLRMGFSFLLTDH
jgi:hypothetical protein